MTFKKLAEFEKRLAAEKRVEARTEAEVEARRALKRAVRGVIPKSAMAPKRPRGRSAVGGVSRKEVAAMRARALRYLDGEVGLRELENEVQRQAIVILLIDGVLGTEPWRASGGPHGGIIAANARLRYLENAARLLDDLRRSKGMQDGNAKLLEGVIDAETT